MKSHEQENDQVLKKMTRVMCKLCKAMNRMIFRTKNIIVAIYKL